MPQRISDVPLADLVPETRAWNDGKGIDLWAWIGCVGSFEPAIGYGELFWPDFALFEECVFFAGFNRESYLRLLKRTGGDKQTVEAVMNHRHIVDLFADPALTPTREQAIYLGRLLKEIWTAKLQRDFPERPMVVRFSEQPSDDLLEYEITLFQERA